MAYIGKEPADAFTSFVKQDFTTSATTSYTLDHSVVNENELALFINFVRQEPTAAYTASGTTLTLTSATASTDDMYCVYLGKAIQTVNPPNGSVGTAQLAGDAVTEAKIADSAVESEHLNNNIISGQTELAAEPADTDEFLVSDAGTIKRVDYSYIKAGANTPYFEAYLSSNTGYLTNNTYVKVQPNSEIVDSDGEYDSTTNYRFTPQTAGKYFIYGQVTSNANGDGRLRNAYAAIYKNGSRVKEAKNNFNDGRGREASLHIYGIIDMNGSTDYVELYGAVDDSSGSNEGYFVGGSEKRCYFGGYKLIG